MGVYIRGMEMPKDCGECHFCHAEGFKSWCCPTSREDVLFNAIPEWCPLIEAPEPSIETTKKKVELKENGDWDCPDVGCDECDHHRSVEWCSLAIPNHEEIDDTYKMVNEAFFEGFDAAEKRYRLLIETIEELDKKLSESVEFGEWIPCSERLPNGQTEVIVSCIDDSGDTKYSYTSSGWITTDKEYWIVDDEINPFVIAWMQLPKPYKGGDDE